MRRLYIMFGFLKRYIEKNRFRSKVEIELHDILRNYFNFDRNIYIYLNEFSTEKLLDCIESLRHLHYKYSNKDIQFFYNCEDVRSILYSDIDKLNNIVEIDIESREYLYNFLKDYISKKVSLSELDLNRRYNKEFFDIFSTIVNIIDDNDISYKKFIKSYSYSSNILFNEINDILNKYVKLYPLSNRDIIREKIVVREPKIIKVSGHYIPTNEFIDYSILYIKVPKDKYEILSPYSFLVEENEKFYINKIHENNDTEVKFNLNNVLTIEHFIRNFIKQK